MKKFEEFHKRTLGSGKNPYTVNFFTFSGHGLEYDGDAIAVIPEFSDDKTEVKNARFINMSGLARRFAGINYTLNIFILSQCRIYLSEEDIHKIKNSNG